MSSLACKIFLILHILTIKTKVLDFHDDLIIKITMELNEMTHHLQDSFLEELTKGKVPVSIFLVNGIKLHGMVDAFDEKVVMLKNNITQMVYKHAISTVVPSKDVHTNKTDES